MDSPTGQITLRCVNCRRQTTLVPEGDPGSVVNVNGQDVHGRILGQDFPGCAYCGVNNYLRIGQR